MEQERPVLKPESLQTADTAVVAYIKELEDKQRVLEKSLRESEYKYLDLQERYDLLLYKRFGRSAEHLAIDTRQPSLFIEETEHIKTAETENSADESDGAESSETALVAAYQRKKKGRKPLNPNLTREERVIDIPEEEKICACGSPLTRIGEETSERLQIIAPRIYVEKIIRPKYACRCCEGTEDESAPAVRIAPVEPSIIPRSIVSPSLLSTIITQKFERHLPYYRQEQQFVDIGVQVSRQDMSNWQQQAYQKLLPLFSLLKTAVKSGPVIQMDETTVQVMGEAGREDAQKSYMWLARGGPPDKKVIWYEYHPTRSAYNAKAFLEGYAGYLQTDGYAGYDAAVKGNPAIIQVGCFAHARRKFFEATKVSKNARSAEEGIKHIRRLYDLENELRKRLEKDANLTGFQQDRKTRAEPILEQFKTWLTKRAEEIPPTMLLGAAIQYSLSQWDKLIKYLESPYLTPDNNACENAIRPFVLGRKNWLFSQSPSGAESSCGMYTLIETAKQNGLVPLQYLFKVFEKAPFAVTSEDWESLLPWNIVID